MLFILKKICYIIRKNAKLVSTQNEHVNVNQAVAVANPKSMVIELLYGFQTCAVVAFTFHAKTFPDELFVKIGCIAPPYEAIEKTGTTG